MLARLVLVAAAALTVAAPAFAKGDVTATMVTPIPTDAATGTPVRVVWSLRTEEGSHPVNADGVYLRVVGADGSRQDAYARPGPHEDGIYAATIRVPAGGVQRAVVGIRGTAEYEDGRSVRRDAFFPLANAPVAGASAWRDRAMPLAALALVAVAAAALGVAWRRRPQGGAVATAE